MSFVEGINVHWSAKVLPSIGGRLVAFRSSSPSLRVTFFSLLKLASDPAHWSPSLPFAIGKHTGIVRSTMLARGLRGRVIVIGHRTSKRYRLLEAASRLRRRSITTTNRRSRHGLLFRTHHSEWSCMRRWRSRLIQLVLASGKPPTMPPSFSSLRIPAWCRHVVAYHVCVALISNICVAVVGVVGMASERMRR